MLNKIGFTLVELSIVLVIIGLLIGGVLVGQSLVESAQLNAQVKQFQQYDIATRTFHSKFRQIPGDSNRVPDPSWGGDTRPSRGDGVIDDYTGLKPTNRLRGESLDFFSHLSQNGFLNEDYRHTAGSSSTYFAGEAHPFPEPILNADGTKGIFPLSNLAGQVFYLNVNYPSGVLTSNPALSANTASLTPVQALALDKKMDDGLPLSGDVVSVRGSRNGTSGAFYPMNAYTGADCLTGSAYEVSLDEIGCALLIKAAQL